MANTLILYDGKLSSTERVANSLVRMTDSASFLISMER